MSLESLRFEDWACALTGGEYAEAYLEDSRGHSLHFEDSRMTEMSSGSDHGAGLRYLRKIPGNGAGVSNLSTIYGSLNTLDPAAAASLSQRLLKGCPRSKPPEVRTRRFSLQSVYRHPFSVPVEEKIGLLERVDRMIRSEFPHIAQVDLVYSERAKRYGMLNSEGDCLLCERISVMFIVTVTAQSGSNLQTGSEVIGGLKGYEIFDDFDPLRAGRMAARCAVEKLSSPVARAGVMPVVLAASAGGTFVHEAIGHSLEADHVQEGTSPHYAGKIGKPVAREFLSIIDDPTLPFARGSYAFDDEGCLAKPTAVVRNGVLVDYLYDRATAMKDGRASNSHGRRESFRHRAIPRMSNLYIAPGADDPRRIIQELDKGLLVTKMGGGQVNTATGEFVFGVDEGFWVEQGEIRHRVRDANMLGVGPEVLQSIDRLGWDIGWGMGTCGKDGQGVPVSDGQPTLRIPKLLIGGREGA